MTHKAVFLDRDDTIIVNTGNLTHPTQVKLISGVGQSLAMLKKMGYLLVVVTNQPGVARGTMTEAELDKIHHHLKKVLADEGVYLDAIYACPYDPDGTVEPYAKVSELQKPQPGMLLKAAEELNIDLSQSWMIGDAYRDIAAGKRAGCQTILLDTPGKAKTRGPDDPEPDKRAVNLREAVNILRMVEFQQKALTARAARSDAEPSEPADDAPTPVAEAQAPQETQVKPESKRPAPRTEKARSSDTPKHAAPAVTTPPQRERSEAAAPQNQARPEETERPVPKTQNTAPHPPPVDADTTHKLLEEILQRLKHTSRYEQFGEFSVFMLLAWLVQALAAFSLVASIWFWLDASRSIEQVQTLIGYAIALELLVIALLVMHDKDH